MDVSQIRTNRLEQASHLKAVMQGTLLKIHQWTQQPSARNPGYLAGHQAFIIHCPFLSLTKIFFIILYFAFCFLTLQIFLEASISYRTMFLILWTYSFCLSSFVVNLIYLSRHKSFVISSKEACSKWEKGPIPLCAVGPSMYYLTG